MLKSELIAMLNNPDLPDVEVLLSKDEEGNQFHVVYDVEFYSSDEEDAPFAFEETGFRQAIVLWP